MLFFMKLTMSTHHPVQPWLCKPVFAWHLQQRPAILNRGSNRDLGVIGVPGLIPFLVSPNICLCHELKQICIMHAQVRRYAADDRWSKRVRLRKLKTHFIFTIQSAGQLRPENVFCTALDTLSHKCDALLETLA